MGETQEFKCMHPKMAFAIEDTFIKAGFLSKGMIMNLNVESKEVKHL
jgi:hypothetical protein